MNEGRVNLWLRGVIATGVVALNIQFFLTFQLSKSVNVRGAVEVFGEVTARNPTSAAGTLAEEGSDEDRLRRVLSDCKLSVSFLDPIAKSIVQARSLDLNCMHAPTP